MILYAVLADVHGNYPALQAVEADARRVARHEGNEQVHFICLGDVVDYGPQPNECMAWVHKHSSIIVQGNHDKAVAAPSRKAIYAIDPQYWPITLWTRRVLDSRHKDAIRTWRFQRVRPPGLEPFTLFHGSLTWGDDGYIHHRRAAQENLARLITDYALFGHTHFQGYFVEDFDGITMSLTCPQEQMPQQTDGWRGMRVGIWEDLPIQGQRALFNPGSVGQPRRHALLVDAKVPRDHRAAYMLLQLNGNGRGHFQFRRVDYDVEQTVRRLRAIRWPEDVKSSTRGNSIYKDGKDTALFSQDPLARQLDETLANMTQLLPRLVEDVLIPPLR